MAPTGSLLDILRANTDQIAYAVGLLQTKPEQLTVREYLRTLRKHAAKGRWEHALSTSYTHLDRTSYWRSECFRETKEKEALKQELDDLKLENDRLKTKAELVSSVKKRKKVDEDIVLVPRSPKKPKQNANSNKKNAGTEDAIAEFDFTSIGEAGNILMRSFYQVNAILKSNQKTDHVRLAHEAVRAASAVSQVLQRTVSNDNFNSEWITDCLKPILTACNRAVLSLIMAFNRLTHVGGGAQIQGKVTHACVKMFSSACDALLEIAKKEVRTATADNDSNIATKKGKSKGRTKQPKSANITASTDLGLFTEFLCRMLDSLEAKNEAQNSLFEGFAYVVLERVGACLFASNFGHTRGEAMEAEIAVANVEDQITDANELTPEERDLKAQRTLAPYLVQLCNYIMKAAPAHLGSVFRTTNGRAVITNKNNSMKGALTVKAKEKLQRTLINCTFGIEGNDEHDPMLQKCLKMPTMSDAALPMPNIKEADVFEWFNEEIWRLLGWDVLSKNLDG